MKLWYQSMSRQTEWGGYPRVLRGILDKVRERIAAQFDRAARANAEAGAAGGVVMALLAYADIHQTVKEP